MISIRFASTSDIPELSEMAFRIWREYFPALISKEQVEYMIDRFQSESAISDQMTDLGYRYGFITDDDVRIGYFSIHPEDDTVFISKIYVSGEIRGQGAGSAAMTDLAEYARSLGKGRMYLHVNRNNDPAIGFYRKNGFEVILEEKTDIGNGFYTDDLVMECRV